MVVHAFSPRILEADVVMDANLVFIMSPEQLGIHSESLSHRGQKMKERNV